MVDEQTGRVVDTEHKGRGYELSKGHYVPIDEDELKAVEIESTHTVDITGFVPKAEIDKRYLDKPYYIAPGGKVGADAFAVIRDAMKDKDRVALAKIVIAHREHVIALEPLGKGLLGTTLRYDYEVRDEKDYFSGVSSPKISKDMVNLAAHILKTKETKFDPRKFKDEYEQALKKLIRRKAKGRTIEEPPPPERTDNVINLMDALRQSLGKRAKTSTKGRRPSKAQPQSRVNGDLGSERRSVHFHTLRQCLNRPSMPRLDTGHQPLATQAKRKSCSLGDRLFPNGRSRRGGSLRRVAVPGQQFRVVDRDGKKSNDERDAERKEHYNHKLGARHRIACSFEVTLPLGSLRIFCLRTSEHRNKIRNQNKNRWVAKNQRHARGAPGEGDDHASPPSSPTPIDAPDLPLAGKEG